jgi:hypothetical protein
MNGVIPADSWSLVTFRPAVSSGQIAAYKTRSAPISMQPVLTTSPQQAFIDVLASAGASIPKRDTIDRRIVRDVVNKTGHSIDSTVHQPEGAWPLLVSTTPPIDTDHDGMPDAWESAHGLNLSDPLDRNAVGLQGYTQLEDYLNSLTGELVTSVADDQHSYPATFALNQNYPNPFNPSTVIGYMLPADEAVTLTVYDVLGQVVGTLVNGRQSAGSHEVTLDGSGLAAGPYYYRLQAGPYTGTKALMLLK